MVKDHQVKILRRSLSRFSCTLSRSISFSGQTLIVTPRNVLRFEQKYSHPRYGLAA